MSNDLLFSVLPREGKVPVVTDERVKRIRKEARAKNLSEDEKESHDEERLISEKQQYKIHEKNARKDKDSSEEHPGKQSAQQQLVDNDRESEDELVYNSHGETEEHHHSDEDTPHIDIYE